MRGLLDPSLVKSRSDFLAFILELSQDFHVNGTAWENQDIESFLEAMAAWANDYDSLKKSRDEPVEETPSWQEFAKILLSGTKYE